MGIYEILKEQQPPKCEICNKFIKLNDENKIKYPKTIKFYIDCFYHIRCKRENNKKLIYEQNEPPYEHY